MGSTPVCSHLLHQARAACHAHPPPRHRRGHQPAAPAARRCPAATEPGSARRHPAATPGAAGHRHCGVPAVRAAWNGGSLRTACCQRAPSFALPLLLCAQESGQPGCRPTGVQHRLFTPTLSGVLCRCGACWDLRRAAVVATPPALVPARSTWPAWPCLPAACAGLPAPLFRDALLCGACVRMWWWVRRWDGLGLRRRGVLGVQLRCTESLWFGCPPLPPARPPALPPTAAAPTQSARTQRVGGWEAGGQCAAALASSRRHAPPSVSQPSLLFAVASDLFMITDLCNDCAGNDLVASAAGLSALSGGINIDRNPQLQVAWTFASCAPLISGEAGHSALLQAGGCHTAWAGDGACRAPTQRPALARPPAHMPAPPPSQAASA